MLKLATIGGVSTNPVRLFDASLPRSYGRGAAPEADTELGAQMRRAKRLVVTNGYQN